MANITGFTSPWNSNRWVNNAEPLDAKTIFDDLEQAEQQIDKTHRFKGQKFVIKNIYKEDEYGDYILDEKNERINIGPLVYWFIQDYRFPGPEQWSAEASAEPPEGEGWSKNPWWDDNNPDMWFWVRNNPPEIIPQPVLFQSECDNTELWDALKTHKHIFKVRKPVTALEVGGVKKGDKLFILHCA